MDLVVDELPEQDLGIFYQQESMILSPFISLLLKEFSAFRFYGYKSMVTKSQEE